MATAFYDWCAAFHVLLNYLVTFSCCWASSYTSCLASNIWFWLILSENNVPLNPLVYHHSSHINDNLWASPFIYPSSPLPPPHQKKIFRPCDFDGDWLSHCFGKSPCFAPGLCRCIAWLHMALYSRLWARLSCSDGEGTSVAEAHPPHMKDPLNHPNYVEIPY